MTCRLDHCNIRTFDIEATVKFYVDIVGLRDGPFGASRSMGAWLYDDTDRPVVHLIAIDPENPDAALGRIRERLDGLEGDLTKDSLLGGGGAIDHVAFECGDYDAVLATLTARGMPYRENYVPSISLRQVFLNDPNGVTLELNFR
jgi:catechol 2,3-dioxygenase-like lactoylglutathione lyase family enzyme